jgi:hypothetical protein
MKHICIITSALAPIPGRWAIPNDDRYKQTIHSIKTVRDKIPGSVIILNDISLVPCDEYKKHIASLVDIFIDSSTVQNIVQLSEMGYKSHGELLLFSNALEFIKQKFDLTEFGRIFKLSGRHNITEEFNIEDYNDATVGKYVFKKSVQSWISAELRIYETRLWSMHKNNIEDYMNKFESIFNSCDGRYDIEHAYYKFLNKNDVVEFDNIWVEGYVGLHGKYQKD